MPLEKMYTITKIQKPLSNLLGFAFSGFEVGKKNFIDKEGMITEPGILDIWKSF